MVTGTELAHEPKSARARFIDGLSSRSGCTVEASMLAPMLFLGCAGLLLLVAAPLLARFVVGVNGDPVGLRLILWAVAVVLLVLALLVRPHDDRTAVFPPSPDQVDSAALER